MEKVVDDFSSDCIAECSTEQGVVVTYLDRLRVNYQQWRRCLPRVAVYYAVKVFPNEQIVAAMLALGSKFDIASVRESDICLKVGARGEDLLSSHPYKTTKQLLDYKRQGVKLLTVDCIEELIKIMKSYSDCGILIRVKSDCQTQAMFNLDEKFGATIGEAKKILTEGLKMGADIRGISFHIGSNTADVAGHAMTIASVRCLYDYALQEHGHTMSFLNIGGGFPGGHLVKEFEAMSENINESLARHFPPGGGVQIVAEPGTYFADPSTDIYSCVIGKRKIEFDVNGTDMEQLEVLPQCTDSPKVYTHGFNYFLNDGVYGSLIMCRFVTDIEQWQLVKPARGPTYPSVLWGVTCDSLDKLSNHAMLPELEVGTWLVRENTGAYSLSLQTDFNSVPTPLNVIVKTRHFD